MNSVALVGRLARDPEVRYSAGTQMAIAKFTVAVDRQRGSKDGEPTADFIPVTCFGKSAEFVEKFFTKGKLIGITGRIQTGSYEKDGKKVYTTDVIADRVEFVGSKDEGRSGGREYAPAANTAPEAEIPSGFEKLADDDIPF